MFSAKEYRAKAAEYAERGRTAEAPNEILEYENLWRRYAEMADNREWVERNFKKTMHDDREADDTSEDAEDQRILRCLGALEPTGTSFAMAACPQHPTAVLPHPDQARD
jgi:hypothetical protein